MWLVVGASRCCESEDTAKVMSGWVITLAYIRHPIISLYFVFPLGISRLGKTALEPGVRSILGSMGVAAGLESSRPKQVIICSIYTCWPSAMVLASWLHVRLTPSSQLIGPKSMISK